MAIETAAHKLAADLIDRRESINRELARNGVRFGPKPRPLPKNFSEIFLHFPALRTIFLYTSLLFAYVYYIL